MKYKANENYSHGDKKKIGVLIVNLGTPDEPTTSAVRRYLAEFLSDPRIVEIPRVIWWLILNLIVLNLRPQKSKDLYKKIWTKEGSPLLVISNNIVNKIKQSANISNRKDIMIDLAMRYGNPSIDRALNNFQNNNIDKLLILPMFPQYSAATTASIFDKVTKIIGTWRNMPDIRFLSTYHDNPCYISACANKVSEFWKENTRSKKLVFSFHGLPQVNLHKGDPYHCYCHKTARKIAENLKLTKDEYIVTFQSRFGKQVWLQPYTDEVLKDLAEGGIDSVDVFCPGFLCDCLETLEEINMQSRENYILSGGKSFNYIPALNDSDDNIKSQVEIILKETSGWDNQTSNSDVNSQLVNELFEKHPYNKKI